jgi:potassium channel LctB
MVRHSLSKSKAAYYLTVLFMLYFNVICTFAIVFFFLGISGHGTIVDHYSHYSESRTGFDSPARYLYFSAITLLSVGYGDLTPFGWAKLVAIIEAMLGYILPATLVLEYIRQFKRNRN